MRAVGDYFKCPEKVEERGKGVGLVDLPKGCLIPVRDPGPGLYEHRHAPTARTDTHADGRNKITCLSTAWNYYRSRALGYSLQKRKARNHGEESHAQQIKGIGNES